MRTIIYNRQLEIDAMQNVFNSGLDDFSEADKLDMAFFNYNGRKYKYFDYMTDDEIALFSDDEMVLHIQLCNYHDVDHPFFHCDKMDELPAYEKGQTYQFIVNYLKEIHPEAYMTLLDEKLQYRMMYWSLEFKQSRYDFHKGNKDQNYQPNELRDLVHQEIINELMVSIQCDFQDIKELVSSEAYVFE